MSTHDKKLFEQRLAASKEDGHCCASGHCWHRKTGAIWMVIKDGHVLQECCRCPETRTIHLDHALQRRDSEDDYKLDSTGNRWKLWAGGNMPAIPGWTSEFNRDRHERGREETKFRC